MNQSGSKKGVCRYVRTPIETWLAPTNASDNREAIRAIKKFKDDKWKALEYLIEKYPDGVA